MVDIPIKRSPAGISPSLVPVGPPGAESSKERSRLERVSDSFKKIQIPELLKALKEAITQKSSTGLPAAVAQGKTANLDSLETKMVERFAEGKTFGEPVPPGKEVFSEKSELQCYQMLEKKLAPYTEERRVQPQSILKAIHRGLYKKTGDKEQVFLFADVVIQKGEKTKTEKMTRIPLEGEAKVKALGARQAPGDAIDPSLLASLQAGDELIYLALSHKVVKPELAIDSEVATADLARAKGEQPEKADRGRFSMSNRSEELAAAHLALPRADLSLERRKSLFTGDPLLPQAKHHNWMKQLPWWLLAAALGLGIYYLTRAG